MASTLSWCQRCLSNFLETPSLLAQESVQATRPFYFKDEWLYQVGASRGHALELVSLPLLAFLWYLKTYTQKSHPSGSENFLSGVHTGTCRHILAMK